MKKTFLLLLLLLIPSLLLGQSTYQFQNATISSGKFNGESLVTGEITFVALTTPTAPVVTNAGTAGVVSYSYKIVAVLANGYSVGSAAGTTTTGNASLDSTNYNIISWNRVPYATSYRIYRSASGGLPASVGYLASVTAPTLTYSDQGAAGDTTVVPTEASTAAIYGSKLANGDLYLYGTQHATHTSSYVYFGDNISFTTGTRAKIYGTGTQIMDFGNGTTNGITITASGGIWSASGSMTYGANSGNLIFDAYQASTLRSVTFQNSASSGTIQVINKGKYGAGNTTPTAYFHAPASTTAAGSAPFKAETGVVMTNAEAGVVEYDGTNWFVSNSTPVRQTVSTNFFAVHKIATSGNIDAKTTAATTIYTVPTGRTMVVLFAIIRCTAADTVTVAAAVSLGANSTSFDDFKGITTLTGVTAANTTFPLSNLNAVGKVYQAADNFSVKVTTGATATSQTIVVDIFGYLM